MCYSFCEDFAGFVHWYADTRSGYQTTCKSNNVL